MNHTRHEIVTGDARDLTWILDSSVHLVLTSPPYANLKQYRPHPNQLGNLPDYEDFLNQLDEVWKGCLRVLVPGGRVCCVVGDVCLSRRKAGRHYVLPLNSDIRVRARTIGFDNLQGISWLKVANISLEASRSARYLGKPNLPNGVIKNDIEHILMLRKPGGYRKPTEAMEKASFIPSDDYRKWFSPIWNDIPGASTKDHPAPFPLEIARRLILMFSFVGDTVLDPFAGTATTMLAAMNAERNSVGVEVDPHYAKMAESRLRHAATDFFTDATIITSVSAAEYTGVPA
ncbi:MAG: site-specific DNA-methyltransferase [Chloroflexi bacterium]|nr:site-specific DNA-methyltransferase [Chloroflexota bacterium]